MKFEQLGLKQIDYERRSPCGERGLKWTKLDIAIQRLKSLPVRGAWIEIRSKHHPQAACPQSLPVRGAWIEMTMLHLLSAPSCTSLPVRGAWIEIWMTL